MDLQEVVDWTEDFRCTENFRSGEDEAEEAGGEEELALRSVTPSGRSPRVWRGDERGGC